MIAGLDDFEAIQAGWQWQEDHPATKPCPRCGTMRNHGCNIKQVIADAAESIREEVDRRALEYAFGHSR